jgi:AbrB family looped-hinge helix DNA binding protein
MEQTILQRSIEREIGMPIVKVIRHGQITLPADFREELAIKEGDYLQAELEGNAIVLRPKVFMDSDDAVKVLHQIIDDVQGRTQGIDPEEIEREVTEAIREVREQKRHAKSRT